MTTKSDTEKAIDVLERVTLAVEALCVGSGDVRSRLRTALSDHLVPLRPTDFPVDLQDSFQELMRLATKYDASDLDKTFPLPNGRSHSQHEGRIQSTMRRIRRSTGAKMARKLWDLHRNLMKIAVSG